MKKFQVQCLGLLFPVPPYFLKNLLNINNFRYLYFNGSQLR